MSDHEILVQSLMRSPVVTISAEAGLDRAMLMMRTQRIRHLPVVDENHELAGIITDRDLRLSMLELEQDPHGVPKGYYLPALTKVSHVMVRQVLTVHADSPLSQAATIMSDFKVGALPVLEAGGRKVVGIVTETDMLRLLTRMLNKPKE